MSQASFKPAEWGMLMAHAVLHLSEGAGRCGGNAEDDGEGDSGGEASRLH
jgi:hypothetical protein